MDNSFGKALRAQMEKAGIKESELARALSYDTTYISKWINGNKLPSARNAERIMGQIAEFFAEHSQAVPADERTAYEKKVCEELKSAYDSDISYTAFQEWQNNEISMIDSRQDFFALVKAALAQGLRKDGGCICITATADIFSLFGRELRTMICGLRDAGVEKVELKTAIEPQILESDYESYAASLLKVIGTLDYIEMSVISRTKEQPQILLINDLLCAQVLWNSETEFAAIFSMEDAVIGRFSVMSGQIFAGAAKLIDPAEPAQLRKTNIQLESYSDKHQRLFFNEPPAMLFPPEVMDSFIAKSEDEEYVGYLEKLKNVFEKHTKKSKVDLVIYSSMINKYLADGCVSVGNVRQRLTEEETAAHLRYLSKVMTENPNFSVYLIRDTVVLDEELQRLPSIFIDSYSLYIENAKDGPGGNYHISMERSMRSAFEKYFDRMIEKPYCIKLTAEDLYRYL